MSIDYPYSLAQLAQILSALDGERRNPNTKRNAIKAIERAAMQLGLTAEDVFDAADGCSAAGSPPATSAAFSSPARMRRRAQAA